ncbi:MAG: Uma2 family endonuclease [Chitinophagaceae bacterium]|nr:Uma2 family endonuclease [Rubrivivax sp.]
MGHVTPHEALALRWAELCADPLLRDLPGKVELNRYGVIEMSPANNRHALKQAAIAHAFMEQIPAGSALVECSVSTTEGVRVPDVAWASAEFMARHGELTPFPTAPEICVEVRSPSNTNAEMEFKTRLFLAAGAVEVWIVADTGALQVFDATGPQPASRYGVHLALAPSAE